MLFVYFKKNLNDDKEYCEKYPCNADNIEDINVMDYVPYGYYFVGAYLSKDKNDDH